MREKEAAQKRVDEFLEALTELSRKTGIIISGCGCCGSPYLLDRESDPDLVPMAEGYRYRDDNGYGDGDIMWRGEDSDE